SARGRAGDANEAPPTAAENRLLQKTRLLADGDPRGLQAARELGRALKERADQPEQKGALSLRVLAKLRDDCVEASAHQEDPWLGAAAVPLVAALDREILAALPALSKRLSDPQESTANRREAAAQLAAGLIALDQRPVRPPIQGPLRSLAVYP